MDRQLVDNLVKVIIEDKEQQNSYNHLDSLLSTMSDEEIQYFLESCGDEVFINFNLSWLLIRTIPEKMKKFSVSFVNGKLSVVDMMEKSLRKEYSKGRITPELFEETIKEYDEVRSEASRFLTLYLSEIEKEIKKD